MELVTDLWAVAVNDDNAPAVEHEIYDWTEAVARMSKLVGDRRPLSGWRERVTAYSDDSSAFRHRRAGPINAPSES
jgi:hypothetical protein